MTRRESAIIGAYTGMVCGPFSAIKEYASELMGRELSPLEMARLQPLIREKAKEDFMQLCKNVK